MFRTFPLSIISSLFTETPHLQGYGELKNQVQFNTIKRKINNRMHFESRRGSQTEANECCKKEGDYYERGSKRIQGERTDLLKIKNQIKEGTRMREIIDSYDIQSHNQVRVTET